MPAPHPLGPVARKLIANIKRGQASKVVDLAAVRAGNVVAAEVVKEIRTPHGLPPTLEVYTRVHNAVMAILEAVQEDPALRKFVTRIQRNEDEYMPSGPPMSPLTGAYFWSWMLWDLGTGSPQETLGSVFLALGDALGLEPAFQTVLRRLADSRLGIFVHEGFDGKHLLLRERTTALVHRCDCGSGYRGKPGQVLLARVLPPVIDETDACAIWGTPYVVIAPDVAGWDAFIQRTVAKMGVKESVPGYKRLMKRGLGPRYWAEYVLEGYVNHEPSHIFLCGLPDVPESRPHSSANEDVPLEVRIAAANRAGRPG